VLVRIEAVIATAGNNEEYAGLHLGQELLGRPLKEMLVTFQAEVTDEEYVRLRAISPDQHDSVVRRMFVNQAIKITSFYVTRNIRN